MEDDHPICVLLSSKLDQPDQIANSNWERLVSELGFSVTGEIQQQALDSGHPTLHCLKIWASRFPDATLKTLLHALQKINRHDVADELKGILNVSRCTICLAFQLCTQVCPRFAMVNKLGRADINRRS